MTLKSGNVKVIPKPDAVISNGNGSNGNGAAAVNTVETPVKTGAVTASAGRRKRTAATV